MIKNTNKGDLIVISGPSGAGKDTLVNEILNEDISLSISATTRDKREGEIDGVDYFFLSKAEFLEKMKNDEFIEYAIVHGENYYGTLKSEVDKKLEDNKDVVLVIDIKGALSIKTKFPDAIFIFVMPPSIKVLKERLIARKTETKESMMKRFTSLYTEINEIPKYNYVVVNDEIELAVNKIKSILISEKCRVDRIEDLEVDTKEEDIHDEIKDYFKTLEQ